MVENPQKSVEYADERPQQRRHPALAGHVMGTGTWAWGDRLMWGFGRGYSVEDLYAVFRESISAEIRLFDTAEVYGRGRSESYLGRFLAAYADEVGETRQPVYIASKFAPFPWRLSRKSLLKALNNSLKRLGVERVDLYQMHMQLPPIAIETWMEAMTEAVQSGKIDAVGISNYDRSQMQRAYEVLSQEGALLASNQVEYHLLNRAIETNGLLKHCSDLGVTVIAYSPLAMGILSGKYTVENPPSGPRGRRYSRRFLAQTEPLITLLKKVGAAHAGKTAAQVAINWTICKGTLPIPGAKTIDQIEQNVGVVGWSLTDEEVALLDETSDRVLFGEK
jgi:aryl-alcohol dehydrogenase-like predicted oxidoreductase